MEHLVRLSVQIPSPSSDDGARGVALRALHGLAAVAARHGLHDGTPCARPLPSGAAGLVFALPADTPARRLQATLRADPSWRDALLAAAGLCGTHADDERFWGLAPYRCPAVGARTAAGGGVHRDGWHRWSVGDGMPSAIVLAILEDRHGHLWLGHPGGLCRFDGACWTDYAAPSEPDSAESYCLCEGPDGSLWGSTHDGGVHRLQGDAFEIYGTHDGLAEDYVSRIAADDEGVLWLLGRGLTRRIHDRFQPVLPVATTVPPTVCLDAAGRLWVLHEGGLARMAAGEPLPQTLPAEATPGGQPVAAATGVWVGGAGVLMHADDDGARAVPVDGSAGHDCRPLVAGADGRLWFACGDRLGWLTTAGQVEWLPPLPSPHPRLRTARLDRAGHAWFIPGQPGAVVRWDGHRLQPFGILSGLGHNRVYGLLTDRHGSLWFGTWGGGLARWDGDRLSTYTTADGLGFDEVESVCRDRRGHLWFATRGGGASRWDGTGFTRYTAADGLAADFLWTVVEDRHGDLWFGSQEGGVSRFDGHRFTTLTTAEGLPEDTVWRIYEAPEGDLWFASKDGGAFRADGSVHLTTALGLAHDRVWDLCRAGDALWLATDDGVSRWDGQTCTNFSLAHGLGRRRVWCVLEDGDGTLWFGTWGGGLARWEDGRFTMFTRRDGLADDNVRAIRQDRRGRLLLCTYGGGLCFFDGQVFQSLSQRDGLAHDAVQDVLEDDEGWLWIATEAGVTRYEPPAAPPSVHLRGVIADQRHGPVDEVSIPSSQSFVLFEFGGASFTTPVDRLAYVYRLVGWDEAWRTTYRPRVQYDGLPQGRYRFQVRAVDRDLNYSAPAAVTLHVTDDPAQARLQALTDELSRPLGVDQFVGSSPALQRVLEQVETVADTDVTVLILGETGTGKGLAARALHAASGRAEAPIIEVNCGAIPDGLVESELFGHEKGAFTGALARRLGRFELAHEGTLFLDEIGDLPQESQQSLLHVLQDGVIQRIGGDRPIQVDVRVVAATNRDLHVAMEAGRFRQDLYYRLSAFVLPMPPLRQRRQDIPLLVHHFLERFARHLSRPVVDIDAQALALLTQADWPGNVRELEHVVQRAVLLCHGQTIRAQHVLTHDPASWSDQPAPGTPGSFPMTLDQQRVQFAAQERQLIEDALSHTRGVVYGAGGAARRLGVHPERLRARMRVLGIPGRCSRP